MSSLVTEAIDQAVTGLKLRDDKYFARVFEIEKDINQMHIQIDESCVNLLAKNSPVAADLRLIVAILKINADLERMGDQAVNISHNGRHYISGEPLKPLIDLPEMAEEAKIMVRDSLEAFVNKDVKLAKQVLCRDDIVDNFKNKIFEELLNYMSTDQKTIRRALDLILIARNLERIGDHATNIAEDAIYVSSGEDVRHGVRSNPPASLSPKRI